MGKVECMITHLVDIIRQIKEKAQRCLLQYNRSTRTNGQQQFIEGTMEKFIVAMDNYFTMPKVVSKLCDLGIGVVGTVRPSKSWPPVELRSLH